MRTNMLGALRDMAISEAFVGVRLGGEILVSTWESRRSPLVQMKRYSREGGGGELPSHQAPPPPTPKWSFLLPIHPHLLYRYSVLLLLPGNSALASSLPNLENIKSIQNLHLTRKKDKREQTLNPPVVH